MNTPMPDFVPARYHHLILKRPEHLKLVRNMFAMLVWSELKRKGFSKVRMATAVRTMRKGQWWTTDITTAMLNNLFTVWSSVVPPQLNDLHQLYSKVCLAHELITVPDALPKTIRLSLDSSDCFLLLHAVNEINAETPEGVAVPSEDASLYLLLATMRILAAFNDPCPLLPTPTQMAAVDLEVVIHKPATKVHQSVPWSALLPPHEDDKPDSGWSHSLAA